MKTLADYRWFTSFPKIAGNREERSIANGLCLRPFGVYAEDLTIDFEHTPRPWLETQILSCCTTDKAGNKPEDDFFWNLDLSKRTECLLAITSLIAPSRQIDIDLRCRNPECLEEMGIEFSIHDITTIQSLAEDSKCIEVEISNQLFSLHKPRGSDQLKWLSGSYPDELCAIQFIINSLLFEEDQQLSINLQDIQNNGWLQTINEVMEEMDPLVNFHLTTNCPYCKKDYDYPIDFGGICLQKLQAAQNRLIEMVHTLAFHYNWNEQEIFALPPWRLQRHLSLIEREEQR